MLFFGVLILIFLQVIRPQDFVPGLLYLPLVQYSMLFFLTLLLFSPIEKRPLRTPQDKFVGVFFIATILSTFTVFWISYMFEVFLYAMKAGLIYFFVIIAVLDEGKLKGAIWTMVVLMAVVGLMGIMQFHGYDITGAGMGWAPTKQAWQIKGIGNFDNPNDLAYSVVFVVPFGLGLLFQSKGFITRIIGLILVALSIYCIYLTRSRGGQLALGASIVTWAYLWVRSPKWRKAILVVSAVSLFVLFTIQTRGFREDASAMGRVDAWSEAWQLVKSHPVKGVGKDQFREYYGLDTHNSYVRAGAELGLIGLFAFVGILYYTAFTLFRVWQKARPETWRIYYCGLASFITSFLVASSFSTRTYDLIILLSVALTSVLGRLSLKETSMVSSEGILFEESRILDKTVFGFTSLVLIAWYLFLRRAY